MEQNQNAETMEQMQQRIRALIELGKKNGKVTSKQLFHTLDAIDADEKQTEKIYDALEHAGIEIDVSDVAEIVASASDLLPTDSEILQLERSGETVSESDNLADLESDEGEASADIREMIGDGKSIETGCSFCGKKYVFSIADLEKIYAIQMEKRKRQQEDS